MASNLYVLFEIFLIYVLISAPSTHPRFTITITFGLNIEWANNMERGLIKKCLTCKPMQFLIKDSAYWNKKPR